MNVEKPAIEKVLIDVLDRVLALRGRAVGFHASTPLLGAVPELDSMGVLNVITTLEEQFGFAVYDDEMEGATFATLGALTAFVAEKLQAAAAP